MSESIETAPEEGSDSGAASTATNASGNVEASRQREAAAASGLNVDSTDPAEGRELPLDQTFELLRNQRRRYVVQYLEAATGQVSLSELAEQIAAWENDKEVRQITSSERKRVYVGLYQCHLPKMDGMGVISFNKPRGLVDRGENASAVEPYLQWTRVSEQSSWLGPRVGLSVLALTLLPVVILLQSQAVLPLVVAVAVAGMATLSGVAMLLRSDADGEGPLDGTEVT